MSKKGNPTPQERPLSQQELELLQTQNEQMQKGIAVAENQEARANEQNQIWKDNYLPLEVQMGGAPSEAEQYKYNQMLNNQMPRYAEDTSGVMDQPAPQPQQGGGSGKGTNRSGKGAR